MACPTTSPAPLRSHRADMIAVLILVAIPLVWFGIPALVGRALAPGDDAIQNFPLRVLAGRQLAAGHLPVFDPYIWGGAPLLGGWNAGALYPFTFLFAILPATGAWAINEIVVYVVAAVGLYAFLRVLPLSPVPSALGAATFSFAGAMDVHLAHFGLVAGMSWIPFVLLAMVKLSRQPTRSGRGLWIAGLGVAGGLSVLAGEPRAIDTTVIVAVLYFVWLAVRLRRRALPFILSVVGGTALATLLGAVQWLPGAMAVATSQRANDTFALFSSGSLTPRWLSLILVPGLLGGSGSFGTSGWLPGYNLPEVMGYVGLLPVVGAFALLGTLRRRRPLPDWLVWHAVALAGGLLAVGSFTPLGHFLSAFPLFGGQRLQSRNIAITDFALAVLLAYWVEAVLHQVRRGRATDRARYLALLPLVAAGLLAAAAVAGPVRVATMLGASGPRIAHAVAQRPVFVVTLVLVLASAAIVTGVGRLAPRRRAGLLVIFVLVDLIAFNVTDVWNIAPGLGKAASPPPKSHPTGASPATLAAAPGLGETGRFAMYDPDGVIDNQLRVLHSPDLNLYDGLFSVQGYSAIVDGRYAEATGSHAAEGRGYNELSPSAVEDGLLDQMDATTLVTSPSYLVRPSDAAAAADASPSAPADGQGPGTRVVAAGADARWDFGETLAVSTISLPWVPSGDLAVATAPWRVALVEPGGRLAWQQVTFAARPSGGFVIRLAQPAPGVGVVIRPTGASGTAGPPVIETVPGSYFVVNGALEDALLSHWSFDGDEGPLAYFTNRHAVAPLSLRALKGVALSTATVRARSGPALEPTSAAVDTPAGAEVIRAVTMIPGWTATWTPSTGGDTVPLAVRRTGLVQAVDVPAGRGIVTWQYDAPGLEPGLIMTLLGVGLVLGLVGGALFIRRLPPPAVHESRLRTARERVPN
jgi:hypothetical protein